MANYQRPGVYVEETLRTKNPEPSWSASTAVFVAPHGRGPTEPQLVRSWSDFARIYGGFPANTRILPYSVFQFFNNGGREAFILRVLGEDAAVAEHSFNDRTEGSPNETLLIEAVNPGLWGDRVFVEIRDRGDAEFDLIVYFGNTNTMNIVERHNELSMNPNSNRYIETVVNSIVSGSSYITAHDAQSPAAETDPTYATSRPESTGTSPVALSGGANGDDPTSSDLTEALDKLDTLNRAYVLNFPGVYDSGVINSALSHVESGGNGFVVIDPPPGADPEAVVAYAESLQTSSYGALYYPHIHIADAGANSQGATKLVPPGGAVCGIIAQTDTTRGVWKAPAGLSARVSGAVSTELRLTHEDLELLNSSHVNAIRHAPGAGFVIWGSRTLKKTQADKYVPIRRSLIFLKKVLEDSTQWAVFEPNDQNLWESLEGSIERFLTGFWQQGGLRGTTANEAFFVRADESINPVNSIEAGVVNVEIGVALQYPAEFIVIKLSQWEGGASASEGLGA